MAIKDLFLRSNVQKGESNPTNDLRLRSDANKTEFKGFGQAQAKLASTTSRVGQAQAIINQTLQTGQAQAFIIYIISKCAQSQVLINAVIDQGASGASGTTASSIILNVQYLDLIAVSVVAEGANDTALRTITVTFDNGSSSPTSVLNPDSIGDPNMLVGTFEVPFGAIQSTVTFTPGVTHLSHAAVFRAGMGRKYKFGQWSTDSGTSTSASDSFFQNNSQVYQEALYEVLGHKSATPATVTGDQAIALTTSSNATYSLTPAHTDSLSVTDINRTASFSWGPSVSYQLLIEDLMVVDIRNSLGQAQTYIKVTQNVWAQAQASLVNPSPYVYGQTQADILSTSSRVAQAQAEIKQTYAGFGQALFRMKHIQMYGQALADILQTYPLNPDIIFSCGFGELDNSHWTGQSGIGTSIGAPFGRNGAGVRQSVSSADNYLYYTLPSPSNFLTITLWFSTKSDSIIGGIRTFGIYDGTAAWNITLSNSGIGVERYNPLGGSTNGASVSTDLTDQNWHRADLRYFTDGVTTYFEAFINETIKLSHSSTSTPSNAVGFHIGNRTLVAGNGNIFVDDVVASISTGDWFIGDGLVVGSTIANERWVGTIGSRPFGQALAYIGHFQFGQAQVSIKQTYPFGDSAILAYDSFTESGSGTVDIITHTAELGGTWRGQRAHYGDRFVIDKTLDAVTIERFGIFNGETIYSLGTTDYDDIIAEVTIRGGYGLQSAAGISVRANRATSASYTVYIDFNGPDILLINWKPNLLGTTVGFSYISIDNTKDTRLQVRVSGYQPSRIQARAWNIETTPPDWQLDLNISSSELQTGNVGLIFQGSSSDTTFPYFDDFLVSSDDVSGATFSQAQAYIIIGNRNITSALGQAQCQVQPARSKWGQVRTTITAQPVNGTSVFAQARVRIHITEILEDFSDEVYSNSWGYVGGSRWLNTGVDDGSQDIRTDGTYGYVDNITAEDVAQFPEFGVLRKEGGFASLDFEILNFGQNFYLFYPFNTNFISIYTYLNILTDASATWFHDAGTTPAGTLTTGHYHSRLRWSKLSTGKTYTVSVKLWKVGDTEPDWLVLFTDDTVSIDINLGPYIYVNYTDVSGSTVRFDRITSSAGTTEHGQAQAQIIGFDVNRFGQARANIAVFNFSYAQAQAKINSSITAMYAEGQAQCLTDIAQIAVPISDISNSGWVGTVNDY